MVNDVFILSWNSISYSQKIKGQEFDHGTTLHVVTLYCVGLYKLFAILFYLNNYIGWFTYKLT